MLAIVVFGVFSCAVGAVTVVVPVVDVFVAAVVVVAGRASRKTGSAVIIAKA